MKKKDKYLFQCKEFCVKCETAQSFYKPNERGPVIGELCEKCGKRIKELAEQLKEPCYWTSGGRIEK